MNNTRRRTKITLLSLKSALIRHPLFKVLSEGIEVEQKKI